MHLGSIGAAAAPGAAAALAIAEALRGRATVSYDPNVRPALLGTPARARPLVEAAVAAAHLIKASDDDIAWLYPGEQPADTARRWLDLGSTAVVITRGAVGAVGYRRDADPLEQPARPVRLVDTIGAGDAFTSGLLDALARAGVRDPVSLAAADLGAALDEAVVVAALTCERAGADPPTTAELARARQ